MKTPKPTPPRAVIGFEAMKNPDVAATYAAVIAGMSGSTAFVNAPVAIADLKTLGDNFNSAIGAAEDGGKKAIAALAKARAALIKALRTEAHYVEANCNDDLTTFLSSGFKARSSTKATPQPLDPPVIKNLKHLLTGSIGVALQAEPKAKSYSVQYTAVVAGATPGPWTTISVTKVRPSLVVSGLTVGTVYAFQARVLGPLGFSNWSDSATLMCT